MGETVRDFADAAGRVLSSTCQKKIQIRDETLPGALVLFRPSTNTTGALLSNLLWRGTSLSLEYLCAVCESRFEYIV